MPATRVSISSRIVPAVAFSLTAREGARFDAAAEAARRLVSVLLEQVLPPRFLLNVNVPEGEPRGYSVTRLGRHSYGSDVVEKVDPRGVKYYWIGGTDYRHEDIPGSDCNAVYREHRVSITPLQLDLTDTPTLPTLTDWGLDRL